jgi:hypothetical protein
VKNLRPLAVGICLLASALAVTLLAVLINQ